MPAALLTIGLAVFAVIFLFRKGNQRRPPESS